MLHKEEAGRVTGCPPVCGGLVVVGGLNFLYSAEMLAIQSSPFYV